MSLPQFFAAVYGWNAAHARPKNPPPPTDEEYERMIERYGP